VLPHYWGYQERLAQPRTTLKQLAEGRWPRVNVTEAQQAETGAAAAIKLASN